MKDFVSIARLLYDLVKNNQKWNWTEKQGKAFKKLKERFTKELVLAAPDLDLKNEDRSQYVRLYRKRSFIDGMQEQTMEAGGLLVNISE